MKKSVTLFSTLAVLFASTAFAQAPQKQHPKHNPEFRQAMSECLAQAGVKKPESPKVAQTNKQADKKELPKDKNGNPQPKEFKGKHGKHPKFEMTDAQRTQVDSCLKQKGFEKPAKPHHKAPKTTEKQPS